jgi:hypothetical protein
LRLLFLPLRYCDLGGAFGADFCAFGVSFGVSFAGIVAAPVTRARAYRCSKSWCSASCRCAIAAGDSPAGGFANSARWRASTAARSAW